jgi:hypothetical protein
MHLSVEAHPAAALCIPLGMHLSIEAHPAATLPRDASLRDAGDAAERRFYRETHPYGMRKMCGTIYLIEYQK